MTEWISVEEATSLTGYDNEYLWWLCRQKRIRCRKVVIVWQIDKDDLLSYKERMEQRKGAGGPRRKKEE